MESHEAFLTAANEGDVQRVRELLCSPDIDINHRDENGDTALLLTAKACVKHLTVIPFWEVEKRGYFRKTIHRVKTENVKTILGLLEIYKELLTREADNTVRDSTGKTSSIYLSDLLWQASTNTELVLVEKLLTLSDVDINYISEKGTCPIMVVGHNIHEVRRHGDNIKLKTKIYRALLSSGADLTVQDSAGYACSCYLNIALETAIELAATDTVKLLLSVPGVDVNYSSAYNMPLGKDSGVSLVVIWTPICIAAFWGHVSIVRILLQHGAHVQYTDDTGRTAIDIAKEFKNKRVARILEKHMAGLPGK